jgi:hypothetical protein
VRSIGLVTGLVQVIFVFALVPNISHKGLELGVRASNITSIESKWLTVENSSDGETFLSGHSIDTVVIVC